MEKEKLNYDIVMFCIGHTGCSADIYISRENLKTWNKRKQKLNTDGIFLYICYNPHLESLNEQI